MSNKHLPHDLPQMQSLPLKAKERMSDLRIGQWFEHWDGNVYVSFSGGKDSTVLADLCAKYCKRYRYTLYLLFVNTGLEYPEIQKFVKQYAEWLRITYKIEVVLDIVRPEMRFDEVLKKYGYPVISKEVSNTISGAKNSIKKGVYSHRLCKLGVKRDEYGGLIDNGKYDYEKSLNNSMYRQEKWRFLLDAEFDLSSTCCDVMKKAPSKKYEKETGRKALIGTLAQESIHRRAAWLRHGCNAFESKRPTSQPLSFWTNQDILRYIKLVMQPMLDKHWENATSGSGYIRRKARKFLKAIGYMRSVICPVYGDIVFDNSGDDVFEGQINIIDYLGCYETQDKLKTTGCDRTGCIFCMFGVHIEEEPNRFQRLKGTHPRQYQYCIGGGEFVWEGTAYTSDGEPREIPWINDDNSLMSNEEIEEFVKQNKDNENFKFVRKWQPSKEGLGLGKVLDCIGVKYE